MRFGFLEVLLGVGPGFAETGKFPNVFGGGTDEQLISVYVGGEPILGLFEA